MLDYPVLIEKHIVAQICVGLPYYVRFLVSRSCDESSVWCSKEDLSGFYVLLPYSAATMAVNFWDKANPVI